MKFFLQKSIINVTKNISKSLFYVLKNFSSEKIFILLDENTENFCFPAIKLLFENHSQVFLIKIKSGENRKNLQTVQFIWDFLVKNHSDRKSLFLILGGGVLCDLGAFAASTFKRGIPFILIPTTLLAQIDAAIGGKTGINFKNLKNEVGTFAFAKYVFIDKIFLKTLNYRQILAGFGEILKTILISNVEEWNNLQKIFSEKQKISVDFLKPFIEIAIKTKINIVRKDPDEKNIRKILNFGHTFAHGFESFAAERKKKLLHGEAVAYGIICELFLSAKKTKFSLEKVQEIKNFIEKFYTKFSIPQNEYEKIFSFLCHDKKNEKNEIRFTILEEIGKPLINQVFSKTEIFEALDFLQN